MSVKLIEAEVLLSDLESLAEQIDQLLIKPCHVLLTGDLSAGKTTFVSAFCRRKGVSSVHSPTFSIHNVYKSPNNESIQHFDLYRLESEDEVQASGFYDLVLNSSDYCFIEWPEKAEGFENSLKGNVYRIEITKKPSFEGRHFVIYKVS